LTSPSQITVDVQPNVVEVDVTETVVTVEPAYAGPQGPPGPQGPAGAPGGARYTHTQAVAAATWIINHNLGYHPLIEVFDTDGNLVEAAVTQGSLNTVTVEHSTPIAGRAELI